MRLICGLVRLDGGPAEPAALRAMIKAMTAPGLSPGILARIGGTAALAVLDFTAGPAEETLPCGTGGWWLAADLRLDRPGELAAALGLPTGSDEESLAGAALTRFGSDLPDRLHGDFALAAWQPAERRLICARDFMGVRPLCYHHRPGRLFAFASLPKGLHASGIAPAALDPLAVGRLMIDPFGRGDATGFEGIRWLPAGASLTLTPDGLRHHQAWRPAPEQVGRFRGSAGEAAETLRGLVEDAVRCRLPPAGPAATHLSGGLDSSAIAVIAARILRARGDRLHGFSLLARSSDGMTPQDERAYVEAVLAQEPDILWSIFHPPAPDEQPPGDIDLPPFHLPLTPATAMCAAAAAAGIPLMLSGAGGDEGATYNGSGLYAALLRRGDWRALTTAIRALAAREGRPAARVAVERLLYPAIPAWLVDLRRRLAGRPARRKPQGGLDFLAPGLRSRVAALASAADWRNRPSDRIAMFTDSYLTGRANRWSILAARYGVAFSYPLLDRRIVDFALSLPLERFLGGGFARQPYRDAMAGILPEAVRWRTDKGIPTPEDLLQLAAAKPHLLAEVEGLRPTVAAQWIDLAAVAAAIRAFPEPADALARLRRAAGNGASLTPPGAIDALRALALARHFARFA